MDLGPYLLRLAVVLPLLCLAIVAALWLARRHLGAGLAAGAGADPGATPRVAGWTALGPGLRLATIDFADRRLLVGVTRAGLTLLAQAERPAEGGGAGADPDRADGLTGVASRAANQAAGGLPGTGLAATLQRSLGHG
ncbi:MAG: flagellar biosynthetic protein FliO [Sphingomonadaceae bacterium]